MTEKDTIVSFIRQMEAPSDGDRFQLKPGLTQTQIAQMEARLARPIPSNIRELLTYTSGVFAAPFGFVDFCGIEMSAPEEIIPLGVALAKDKSGNFWVIDIRKDDGEWGPVVFMSHDPPVAVIQAPTLSDFIEQVLFDREDVFTFVTKAAAFKIWELDPYLMDSRTYRMSDDSGITRFGNSLSADFKIADLRPRKIGSGFAWGRGETSADMKRDGSNLLFGLRIPKTLIARLFRRK